MDTPSLTRRQLLAGVTTASAAAGIGIVTAGPTPRFEASPPDSGSWPMAAYDPQNTGHNRHAAPPRDAPTVAWQADAPEVHALVVADGTLFAGSDDAIVALDSATGTRRWRRQIGGESLCVRDGTLYAISNGTAVTTALDAASGETRWQVEPSSNGWSLLPGDDALYVGLDGAIEARNPDTGEKRWSRAVAGRGYVNAGIADGRLYVHGPGRLSAFESRENLDALLHAGPEARWRTNALLSPLAPTTTDDAVFVGSQNPRDPTQTARAYDSATGESKWESPPFGDAVSPPAVADGVGFVAAGTWKGDASEGVLAALDVATGEVRWRRSFDYGVTRPIVADGAVFAGTYEESGGPVRALDAATGRQLWSREFDGQTGPLAAVNRTLYVGTHAGSVRALRL